MDSALLYEAAAEATSDTVSSLVNVGIANWISDFVGNGIVITLLTTVISIVVGVACTFKNRFWRNFTFILCAVLLNLFMLLRLIFISEPWYVLVFALIISSVLCFVGIKFLRGKEIVSRKKIGKMIENFTATANPSKDVCIFAGDIDFFGEVPEDTKPKDTQPSINQCLLKKLIAKVITPIKSIWRTHLKKKTDIKYNRQFKQLNDPKFRSVCILCAKPLPKKDNLKDDYHKDRIRIGYLKEAFGERVHFKFFNEDCDNCFFYEQNNCMLQKCSQECHVCTQGSFDCPKNVKDFSHPSLPDTTLRGRIVTDRETDSKCVAITTKRSSGKEYILRQYGSGEKESSLYSVIWKVWWKMCEEDNGFIDACVNEYKNLNT